MTTYAPVQTKRSDRPDGSIVLSASQPLEPHAPSIIHDFRSQSERRPHESLIVERRNGEWVHHTWSSIRHDVDALAQALIDRSLTSAPTLILGGPSRLHLVVMLASMSVGTAVTSASVAYSLQSGDHAQLRRISSIIKPGLVVADDNSFAAAVAATHASTVLTERGDIEGSAALDDLTTTAVTAAVDDAVSRLTADTVAKYLFSSGSTGDPKGVITTHGMLAANQQQIRQVWPFLSDEPPILLDWLPWSHTFGGSHNLNMVLTNGGTIWIDDGRPHPDLVGKTAANLAEVRPTIYFNVPAGYATLLPILEANDEIATAFLERLRIGFFAGAALPQQIWDRIRQLVARHEAHMTMTTSWGLTETSPACTSAHFNIERSDCLGVPLPGVEIRLVPVDTRYEARIRGPHVTPGYLGREDLTAEAFDEEGFFRTGDAMSFADETNANAGLIFAGRTAEEFKLSTGTWVQVGTLRPQLISASEGLITDAVICGHDTDAVSALVWINPGRASELSSDGVPGAALRGDLESTLTRLAQNAKGSAGRVERLAVLTTPAALDAGEITDKGYVNQRAVRDNRSALVTLVVSRPEAPQVVRRAAS